MLTVNGSHTANSPYKEYSYAQIAKISPEVSCSVHYLSHANVLDSIIPCSSFSHAFLMVRLTNGESVHTNITAIKRVAIAA